MTVLVAIVAVATALGVGTAYLLRGEPGAGDGRAGDGPVPRLGPLDLPALPARGDPLLTFVAVPDFVNNDVADVRGRPGASLPPGANSTNASWEKAVAVVLDQVRSERPDAVLVAGDLVGGHWGVDVDGTGAFGPVGTEVQRSAAVTLAGEVYFGQWARWFSQRRLTVLPAVGDHDIGDNPWPAGSFKARAVATYRRAFARQFTLDASGVSRYPMRPLGTPQADTAYAVRLGDTLIVSVDVFAEGDGGVVPTVEGGQLAWLDRLLGEARRDGVDHIIVQGHTPVLAPVRERHSSGLLLEGGADSPFWQVLRRHRVDLYLCGEVHDMTTRVDGPVQVCSGGRLSHGESNYLLGRIYPDRIELELKEFSGWSDWSTRLWSTSTKRPAEVVGIDPGPSRVGTAVVEDGAEFGDRLRDPRGYLAPPPG